MAPLAEQAGVNLELDSDFLLEYGIWDAIRQNPTGAALLGIDDQVAAERPMAKALAEIAADPNLRGPLDQLVTFVRRRVLEDEYNLDPERMRQYTELYGPLDCATVKPMRCTGERRAKKARPLGLRLMMTITNG